MSQISRDALISLMDDDTFFPSSPSTVYSMALDYEQSQHAQEVGEAREAQMSMDELEAATEQRHLKRMKRGYESPIYHKEQFFRLPPSKNAQRKLSEILQKPLGPLL